MRRSSFTALVALSSVICLCATSAAAAQSDGWDWGESDTEEKASDQQAAGSAEEPVGEPEPEEEQAEGDDDPSIKWLIGMHGRINWIPPAFQQLFLDEAPAVVAPGFNLVATYRVDDGFSVVFGLGYISYAVEGPYRAKGDLPTDTEYIDANLGLANATASLLWNTRITNWMAFEYGFGLDLGIVTGQMVRTEAYQDATSGEWQPCIGPLNPNWQHCAPTQNGGPTDAYDQEGEHYGVVEERVPPVLGFPAIPHLALRFEPDPHLALKLEMGYGILQFWFGLSAHYGFET